MDKKTLIMVACHKRAPIYEDEIYRPIEVGATNHQEQIYKMRDNSGDNISSLNPNFCELTAIYWAWKNLKDVEYVGLQHYRRYFETKFTNDNIDKIFSKCDVVLANPIINYYPISHKLGRILSMEDFLILKKVIRKVAPDYEKSVVHYLSGHMDYPYNMLICRKVDFDSYCEWLFRILFECQKYVRLSPYTCSSRIFGYMAENLLPIYFIHNDYRIRTENVVSMIGEHVKSHPIKDKLHLFLLNAITFYRKREDNFHLDGRGAEEIGLINDGIVI